MDNKDQGNNSVGDGSNLSPENQLPPIWDNISQELNALDGDAVSVNEQAIDAKITSYGAACEASKASFNKEMVRTKSLFDSKTKEAIKSIKDT